MRQFEGLTGWRSISTMYVVDRAPTGWPVGSQRLSRPLNRCISYILTSPVLTRRPGYFVLAGLAVFERETYHLAQSLDQIQARYLPTVNGRVPFRASSLRAREGRVPPPFDSLTEKERQSLITEIYGVIANSRARLFAVAMEKAFMDGDPYERGFEEIVNRFDLMLQNDLRNTGERQRGLIVVAESSYRENLELLAERIATQGHRWGETHNLADIPYFAPAKSTRLLQLADFVANAI